MQSVEQMWEKYVGVRFQVSSLDKFDCFQINEVASQNSFYIFKVLCLFSYCSVRLKNEIFFFSIILKMEN